ncbi:hypothetical protein GCM10010246_14630 [Streptomyces cuspidosporus]|uniref:Uncharacterized protein n=1 Tax=Streptomyces cuspidosporus TaxID=66882 RepID=A0ABN3FL36_9ACTN
MTPPDLMAEARCPVVRVGESVWSNRPGQSVTTRISYDRVAAEDAELTPEQRGPGRVYRELARLGEELETAGGLVAGLRPDADAAFLSAVRGRRDLAAGPVGRAGVRRGRRAAGRPGHRREPVAAVAGPRPRPGPCPRPESRHGEIA